MAHYRVTVTGFLFGQTCQNVIHLEDPDGAVGLATTCTLIRDNWVNKHTINQGNNVRYTNILASDADNPAVAPFSLTIDRSGQGLSAERCPSFACFVMKLLTAVGGRHGRGRVFFPGPAPDNFQFGVLTSGFITQWNDNVITPIMAAFGPSGSTALRLCVRARMPDGPDYNRVVSCQLRPVLGVQRRRNIGVGI